MIGRFSSGHLGLLFFLGLMLAGCMDQGGGSALRSRSFEYPVGIAVHPKGFALVLSSNFDLARSSGSLRAMDLNRLAERIQNPPQDADEEYHRHREVILDEAAVVVGNFAGGIKLDASDDGGMAALTVRENNQLILVKVLLGTDGQGQPSIDLQCRSDGTSRELGSFPACEGEAFQVQLQDDDPFDLLLFENQTLPGSPRTAFVSFLQSGNIVAIELPNQESDLPNLAYSIATGEPSDDLALSPATGMIYFTRRAYRSGVRSNPVRFFDPVLGEEAVIYQLNPDLFPSADENRGIDFTEDGMTAVLLVRGPDMLLFLDTSIGYKGHVVLDDYPARVKTHADLVFVTSSQGDLLYAVDAQTMRLIGLREDVCRGPFDMEIYERIDLDLQWLLVTCFEDHSIAVLDANRDSADFFDVLARVGG